MSNEKWYQSRRIWGAILSGITVVFLTLFPEQATVIGTIASSTAGILGIYSWVSPK